MAHSKRILHNPKLMARPVDPDHLVHKAYVDERVLKDVEVLNGSATLEINSRYIAAVSGDYLLPEEFPVGKSIEIYCAATQIRVLNNGHVIGAAGVGNNLVLAAGNSVTLVSTGDGQLKITTASTGTGSMPGTGGEPSPVVPSGNSEWIVLDSTNQQFGTNLKYIITLPGTYLMPSVMSAGQSVTIHSKVSDVIIGTTGYTVSGVPAESTLALQAGDTVTVVASSPTTLELT